MKIVLFDLCEFKIGISLLIWTKDNLIAKTYVHSYSFHRSMHSNGSGQMTFEHGLFDGQLRSRFRAIVACPHWVPFIAGGSGRCFPSSLWRKCNDFFSISIQDYSEDEDSASYLISSKQLF